MQKRVPYLSFRTFTTFLDELGRRGLPRHIDRTLLAGKSRSVQSQILSTLIYLGLTDERGMITEDLARLVQSEGRERQQAWEDILRHSYSGLFELDIEKAATEEFLDEFLKSSPHSEGTLRKALNFFSLASRAAGIRISPHIKPYAGGRQSSEPGQVNRKDRLKVVSLPLPRRSIGTANDPQTLETLEILIKQFPEFDPSWPMKERQNWLEGFEEMLRILKENDRRDERAVSAKESAG
jgi:hypothetical protein